MILPEIFVSIDINTFELKGYLLGIVLLVSKDMSSKRSRKQRTVQNKLKKTVQASSLWKQLNEKQEEQVNGGCYICGYYGSNTYW